MTIHGIRLTRHELTETRDEAGDYVYTVRAEFVPYGLPDGTVTDISGIPLDLLRAEGWQHEARTDLHYQADATGGSPSLAAVVSSVTAWLGAEMAARMEAWVGRKAVAFVTDKEQP